MAVFITLEGATPHGVLLNPEEALVEFDQIQQRDKTEIVTKAIKNLQQKDFNKFCKETDHPNVRYVKTRICFSRDCDGHLIVSKITRKETEGYWYVNERTFVLKGENIPGALQVVPDDERGRLSHARTEGALALARQDDVSVPAKRKRRWWLLWIR